MTRLRHALLLVTLAAAASLAAAAPASAATPQLGPRPASGGAGGMSVTASPSILHINDIQSVNMTTDWSTFWSPNAQFGPWIYRTSIPSLGSGVTLQSGNCSTVLYYAGSLSCTVKATSATGGWRTHNFTIVLNNGSSATYRQPYAVMPPGVYSISGKLTQSNPAEARPTNQTVPAAGVEVIVEEVGGDGGKYTTTTNADGIYDAQVEQGTWRVRVTDRKFCYDGSSAACERKPTTTVPGDRTLNFTAPKPVKVSGSIKTKDGAVVKDAWILAKWTDEEGETQRIEDKSATDGTYKLEGIDPGADVTLWAQDENVCVSLEAGQNEIGDNGRCRVKERVITPLVDTTIDFTKPGCLSKVDFLTSMQAIGSCFKTTDPEQWETTEPFRMNGFDVTLHGENTKAIFDGTRRTFQLASDSDTGWAAFTLPYKGVSLPVGALPAGAGGTPITFETALTKMTFTAGKGGGGIPESATKLKKLGGFPVTATESVEFLPAGVSTIAAKLAVPSDISKQWGWDPEGGVFKAGDKEAKTIGISAKATTDNLSGATALEGKLDGITNLSPGFKCAFDNSIFGLKELKLSYSWSLNRWTFGGKMELNFLKRPTELASRHDDDAKDSCGNDISGTTTDVWGYIRTPGDVIGTEQVTVDEVAKTLEGSVTTTGVPGFGGTFESATFTLDGLNRKGPMGLYFQRGGATIPLNTWTGNNGANAASVRLGVSVGPKNANAKSINVKFIGPVPVVPSEAASFDGELGLSWQNFEVTDTNQVAITGKLDAKVWDQPIGTGTVALYPNQGLLGGSFALGFTDPTGGTIFSMRAGAGDVWYDQRRAGGIGGFYVSTRAAMTILGRGVVGDVIVMGPAPTRLGACGEFFGVRIGGVYDYDGASLSRDSTCDLSAFKADRPVPIPPVSASRLATQQGAKQRRFTVKPGQQLVTLQVSPAAAGAGRPPALELRGPGLKLKLPGDKTVSTGKVATLLDPLSATMTIIINAPKAGGYTVSATGKDAPALAVPKFASVLPDPEVTAQLTSSQCAPQISWSGAGVKGQTLQFIERTAAGSERVIAEVTPKGNKASGTLKVNPLPGAGRSEVRVLVANNGTPRKTIELGSFTSGAAAALPGPANVTFKNAGTMKSAQGKKTKKVKASTVSWLGVCGATGYAVQVGKGKPLSAAGTSQVIPRPKKNQAVTITTFGPGGPAGSTLVPFR